jgi:hypothetical protein
MAVVREIMKFIRGEGGRGSQVCSLPGVMEKQERQQFFNLEVGKNLCYWSPMAFE